MKEIGYCQDCKWWEDHDWEDEADKKACNNDSTLYQTNGGQMHPFFTGPEFGCIHWEGK